MLRTLYTRAELLDAIRRWAELYGSAPVRTDWAPERARQRCDPDVAAAKVARYESGEWPSAATVRSHFGSFSAAVEAAGVHAPPGRGNVRWSDEAIIDALRDLAYECGRPPRPGDLEHGTGDLPGVDVIVMRFGSWGDAITAAGLGGEYGCSLYLMTATEARELPDRDNRELIIDAAREALEREDSRAERLDAKARGQMTLAGSWFAVVQAVAAVALQAGMSDEWLIAVGASAAAAAVALIVAMAKSAGVWRLKSRPAIGTKTIDAMTGAVDRDDFKKNMVIEYQHLLGQLQIVNYERAKSLDGSTKAWWTALGLGLVELALALVARIAGG